MDASQAHQRGFEFGQALKHAVDASLRLPCRCGIFDAPIGKMPHVCRFRPTASLRVQGFHSWDGRCPAGPAFAITGDRSRMLRASVVPLVLLLAIGQDTALLCRAWCQPDRPAMAECEGRAHTGASSSVTGDDGCVRVNVSGAMLPGENVRRGSDQDTRYAIVVPPFQVPASPVGVRHGGHPDRASAPESQRLIPALRI
jgi:hypothetical protein